MPMHKIVPSVTTFLERYNAMSGDIAVAVSGGADSMALAHMLGECTKETDLHIHILSVDHGLRAEAIKDAEMVSDYFSAFNGFTCQILNVEWGDNRPQTAVMKAARDARYELMRNYCCAHNIRDLFVAHHGDDQAETFLMRLSKGSGLDGLSAMGEVQNHHTADRPDYVYRIMRPLLSFSHSDLVNYCRENDVPWVEDPTNDNTDYTRNKWRATMGALKEEGLTPKRLSLTAKRLLRARHALEQMTADAINRTKLQNDHVSVHYDWEALREYPEEIILRVILDAYSTLLSDKYYPPRLEKLEDVLDQLLSDEDYKARTLGGLIIRMQKNALILEKE